MAFMDSQRTRPRQVILIDIRSVSFFLKFDSKFKIVIFHATKENKRVDPGETSPSTWSVRPSLPNRTKHKQYGHPKRKGVSQPLKTKQDAVAGR